jgi:tetratricopeptide (TPR) repeat protein
VKPSPAPASSDFDAPTLDDAQLIQLFALEDRKELPTCVERLGDSAARYSGSDPRQSVLQVKAARRELMRGKSDDAHQFFCGATAHDPRNVTAHQGLAELLLQLGDPAQARATAERALEHAPDNKEVIALRGDALALLGDLATSRQLWLSTLPEKGSTEERTRRLASTYRVLGDRALRASGFGTARSLYRRSVILSSGSYAPSIGLSEALLWLGHRRAALVWSERTARAFPKDSRVQLLYGDALYDNERPEEARAAWQAAVDAQPGNVTAQRRLIEGRR